VFLTFLITFGQDSLLQTHLVAALEGAVSAFVPLHSSLVLVNIIKDVVGCGTAVTAGCHVSNMSPKGADYQ